MHEIGMRGVSLIDLRRRLNSGKSPSAGLNRECAKEIERESVRVTAAKKSRLMGVACEKRRGEEAREC